MLRNVLSVVLALLLIVGLAFIARGAEIAVCPTCTHTTISSAVAAASPGDTIRISAHTYDEQVHVTKNLTLQGSGVGKTFIRAIDNMSSSFTSSSTNVPVVFADNANVTVRDLTIDGLKKGNTNHRLNGIGVDDGNLDVRNVRIVNIQDPTFSGSQRGIAVLMITTGSHTAYFDNVTLSNYQKGGLVLHGDGLVVGIENSTITGRGPTGIIAQNGIQISGNAIATINDSTISGHSYTGGPTVGTCILDFFGSKVVTNNNTFTECEVGIYDIGGDGIHTGNQFRNTVAGTGIASFWGCIGDAPGGSMPPTSPHGVDRVTRIAEGEIALGELNEITPEQFGARATNQTLTYKRNLFVSDKSAGGTAIEIFSGFGPENIDLLIQQNTIENWGSGVGLTQCSSSCSTGTFASILVTSNAIVDATFAVRGSNLPFTANVQNNWFGCDEGPLANPSDCGTITGAVDVDPWAVLDSAAAKVGGNLFDLTVRITKNSNGSSITPLIPTRRGTLTVTEPGQFGGFTLAGGNWLLLIALVVGLVASAMWQREQLARFSRRVGIALVSVLPLLLAGCTNEESVRNLIAMFLAICLVACGGPQFDSQGDSITVLLQGGVASGQVQLTQDGTVTITVDNETDVVAIQVN